MALTLHTLTLRKDKVASSIPDPGTFELRPVTDNHTLNDVDGHRVWDGAKRAANKAGGVVWDDIPALPQPGIEPGDATWELLWYPAGSGTATLRWGPFILDGDKTLDELNDPTGVPVTPSILTEAQAARDEAEAAATSAETAAASVQREQAGGVAGLTAAGKLYEARIPDRLSDASLTAAFAPQTTVTLPAPTGVAATDSAALAAAITAAGSSGVIQARVGAYSINAQHVIPDGVDLRGMGGGSASRTGRTRFVCTTAGAGIEIAGGGGQSGGFEITGGPATQPFKRSGGAGANARTFHNITVQGSAQDAALFYGAQNDLWYQCGFAVAVRDLVVFDQGYGGALFLRCEFRDSGRYHHHFDNQVAGGPYPVPTDIKFVGGICEGNTGTSEVYAPVGTLISYWGHPIYSANGCTGPMVDLVGTGLSLPSFAFHDPWLQSTPNTRIAGSIGIRVSNQMQVTLSGRGTWLNLETVLQVVGAAAKITAQSGDVSSNNGNFRSATSGGNVNQIGPAGTGATDHDWTSPALTGVTTNPTPNFGPFGYTKQRDGLVRLRGDITAIALNTTLVTLPAGYRPAVMIQLPITTITGAGVVTPGMLQITAAGAVSLLSGSGNRASFENLAFIAEQ